jgi:5'(3')-deoxyribonucleotidase
VKSFKEMFEEIKKETVIIYCDMDGVIADFVKFADKKSGGKFSDQQWDKLPSNTYELLDLMPDAKKLWSYISKYNVRILTAYPSAKRGEISKKAPSDKINWMKKFFNFPKNKIHTVLRIQKQDYAKKNAILIDDDMRNIKEFNARGGTAIHHKSANETIKKLKGIGL